MYFGNLVYKKLTKSYYDDIITLGRQSSQSTIQNSIIWLHSPLLNEDQLTFTTFKQEMKTIKMKDKWVEIQFTKPCSG